MTRDEILALTPGPELDKLVAEKVMGWEVCKPGDIAYSEDGIVYKHKTMRYSGKAYKFSSDLWACFKVVMLMSRNGWNNVIRTDDSGVHRCCFAKKNAPSEVFQATSVESNLEAICKAALLAVSGE